MRGIMTVPAPRRPSLAGRLLIVAGVGLFSLWVYYFLNLVRPVDAWDFCALPMAMASILIGVKIAGLDQRLLTMIGVSYKRDVTIALAIGALVEFTLWVLTGPDLERATRYSQLARLQEPGVRIGLTIYKHASPHLGRTWSLWVAEPCAFLVLIAIWSASAFALLRVVWFLRTSKTAPHL
jgi:hypothetical protein